LRRGRQAQVEDDAMTWNYRIVRYADGSGFGLHEVFYENGAAVSMTVAAIPFVSDSEEGPQGVIESLRMALADAENRPVLDEREIARL
jgi:hypothetical protein